jgi:hypothetical protein
MDEDNTINQRYTIHATIADIYKQNKSIIQDQYLVYENDFILSQEIPLTSFRQTTSPIQFTLTNKQFPANIKVTNEEEKTVQLYCAPSISIERVCQIACQLFDLNKRFYCLTFSDDGNIKENYLLKDAGESMDNIQLKLKSIADVKCQVIYEDKTVCIPSNNETLVSTLLTEVLEKLSVPNNDMHMYKLIVIDDPKCPTQIDLDSSINEIRSFFPEDITIIPFQLQKRST